MKTYPLIVLVLCFALLPKQTYSQSDDPLLGTYLSANNYFELNQALRNPDLDASEFMLLLSNAVDAYYFNRPKKAIENLKILLTDYKEILGNDNLLNLTILMAESYGLLGDYKKAAEVYDVLIKQIEKQVNVDSLGYIDAYKRFKALSSISPQKMTLTKTTLIPVKSDTVGLTTVPVKINNFSSDFVFDTGAGYSLINEEDAVKAGIQVLDNIVNVTGFSKVPMKMGVADKIIIGDAVIENVVFLINPERTVLKEVLGYEIKGIIGLHTMIPMREVQLDRTGTLTIPYEPSKYPSSNLMIKNLVPYVQAFSDNNTLIMGFDTGAVSGGLSARYYNKYKSHIEQFGVRDSINMAGVGGSVKAIPVFKIKQFPLLVGEAKGVFPSINVGIGTSNGIFENDGVIGQDFLKLFTKMTINFDDMYLKFE